MPWDSVEEAEKAVKGLSKYSAKGKRAWLSAFNSCYEKHGEGDDGTSCYAVAHAAAKSADNKEASMQSNKRVAASMSFEDYWAWLENLKIGDEVMLYWTAGSFGHYKARARLVKINAKSVVGELLEDVPDYSMNRHGYPAAYSAGYTIVVPRDMTDRRHRAFFNAPMPIGVDKITPNRQASKESSMKKTKVAKKLVKLAKELLAAPMATYELSSKHIVEARQALMDGLGVSLGQKQVLEEYMTLIEGTKNRFHYFGVWVDKSGQAVGGNAYGRIGYTPKSIMVAQGGVNSVMSEVQSKMRQKRAKGYQTVG